jgi:hypothetical protein
MSALGYLVWLMHTENQRRDRLRAKGDLAHTTPAYEMIGHWLAHPWLTRRARSLAKADAGLGLYDSLDSARAGVRRARREAAISKVLHRKIRAAVKDKDTADIAVHSYDLDEIAARLAAGADYDGLTALIAADLTPARLAAGKGTGATDTPAGEAVPAGGLHAVPAGGQYWDDDDDADDDAYYLADPPPGTPEPISGAPVGSQEGVPAASKPKRRPPVRDQVILKALKDPYLVPRRPDGTVAVRELERRWGARQDRAKRLLIEAGLYQLGDPPGVPEDGNGAVPADRELEDANA